MSMDVTAGLDLTIDEVTANPPTNPDYREGTSMWIWDDAGRVGLPRIAIECVGSTWDTARMVMVNVALPDGRNCIAFDNVPAHPVADAAGRPRVLGAGPIRFECVEPFVRWRLTFDGEAAATTVQDQIGGRGPRGGAIPSGSSVPFAIDIDTKMAAPPWVQGSLGGEGFIRGEERFEQLFNATGTVRIDGEEIPVAGGGLRIHRKGANRTPTSDFFGHAWQSALFPSGRAFGYIHYYPRPDGSLKFVEGWVMDVDGEVLAAQLLTTPWMRDMQPSGEEVPVTFRTSRGDIRIEGATVMSTFHPQQQAAEGVPFPTLQQGIARYTWDGEEALGMIERSTPRP
jgi:hypothetical protein